MESVKYNLRPNFKDKIFFVLEDRICNARRIRNVFDDKIRSGFFRMTRAVQNERLRTRG